MPPVIQGRFTDFDQFAEAATTWDIDFRQVGNGRLSADLVQVLDEHTSLAWARFSHCCWQQGLAHPGTRTFAMLHPKAPGTRFCGQSFEAGDIALFGTDEFECISPPGFDVFTVSISQDDLERLGEATGMSDKYRKLGSQPEIITINPKKLHKLRLGISNVLKSVLDGGNPSPANDTHLILKDGIPALLLETLWHGDVRKCLFHSDQRQALLRRARDYIHCRIEEPVRVLDIALELGTTTRTLELTFRELLDITPREYINTSRLYAFHRCLRATQPGNKVSDIANDMGYWHMGELARMYRLRFGELPSVTLKST